MRLTYEITVMYEIADSLENLGRIGYGQDLGEKQ
jgi:hypothetical protein